MGGTVKLLPRSPLMSGRGSPKISSGKNGKIKREIRSIQQLILQKPGLDYDRIVERATPTFQ